MPLAIFFFTAAPKRLPFVSKVFFQVIFILFCSHWACSWCVPTHSFYTFSPLLPCNTIHYWELKISCGNCFSFILIIDFFIIVVSTVDVVVDWFLFLSEEQGGKFFGPMLLGDSLTSWKYCIHMFSFWLILLFLIPSYRPFHIGGVGGIFLASNNLIML